MAETVRIALNSPGPLKWPPRCPRCGATDDLVLLDAKVVRNNRGPENRRSTMRPILYTQESFVDAARKIVPEGLPVVYDSVGKTTFEDSLKCLRPRGLVALYGGSSGAVPPFDLIRLSTMGSLYVTRPTLKDYVQTRAELERRARDVFTWVAAGKLRVRIGHRYSLAEAQQAHIDLQARKTTGKVLIIP